VIGNAKTIRGFDVSEMIERIAKVLRDLECETGCNPELAARAAIEAMREPTEAMKNCDEEVHWGYSCHMCGGLTEGWNKMFKAALTAAPIPPTLPARAPSTPQGQQGTCRTRASAVPARP
jgi:hypothetical protein